MVCRKNVRDMTSPEKDAYVKAVLDLKNSAPSLIPAAQAAGAKGRYDDYVWIHLQVQGGAHDGPAFLPWHREFLRQFELDLQAVSGNPAIRIPYWDWTTAQGSSAAGWPFTGDFLGGMGDSGDDDKVTTGPFAYAAGKWNVNVRTGQTTGVARDDTEYLRRRSGAQQFALPSVASARQCLDRLAYDAAPWFNGTTLPTNDQLLDSFRKYLEWVLHNNPHGWVAGNMMPQTSPNDPVFFLHHCNVDRLWAVWQQKHDAAVTAYQPPPGTTANHDSSDVMSQLLPAYFSFPLLDQPTELLAHKTLGFRYASDKPSVTPTSLSVSFGDVPNGLTTYFPASFEVESCRPVHLRITAIGGAGFAIPSDQGPQVTIQPDPADAMTTGQVFIQFTATSSSGVAQTGTVDVEAFFIDEEGYYADAGDEVPLGSWTLGLTATPVARPTSGVVLVLDRSGSMGSSAGGSTTRVELLKDAVSVFSDLLREDDGIGLVTYDDLVDRVMDVTLLGTVSPPGPGRVAVAGVLAGNALDPRNNTAIGSGLLEGASALADGVASASPPFAQTGVVVLTDGNENVTPFVSSPAVQAAVTSRTFAVGLGRENQVSAPVLSALAGGSGGYMLITGDMNVAQQRFKLTKYFVQILAGVTNAAVLTDPEGELFLGDEHRIPFDVSDAEVEVDVIALCPAAALLDFQLEAPDGSVLAAGSAGPNARYVVNGRDAFWRVTLPALPSRPEGTHAGRWHAILRVSKERMKSLLAKLDASHGRFPDLSGLERGTVPYSLIVHAYSDLKMLVSADAESTLPGARVRLEARLREHGVPLPTPATVRVIVTDAHGESSSLALEPAGKGRFTGSFPTTSSGTYTFRFLATGSTRHGRRFQREDTRTVAVLRDSPVAEAPSGHDAEDRLCRAIACLLSAPSMRRLFDRLQIDPDEIRRCLTTVCRDESRRPAGSKRPVAAAANAGLLQLLAQAEPASKQALLSILRDAAALGIESLPKAQPVPRTEREKDHDAPLMMTPLALEKGKVVQLTPPPHADHGKADHGHAGKSRKRRGDV